MEDVRNRRVMKVVRRWEKRYGAGYYIARSNFRSSIILDENITLIEMDKTCYSFNKPIQIGFSVLDLSKILMYSFYYDYVKKVFPGKESQLLYMDTDSYVLLITGKDPYEVIRDEDYWFDTSDYQIPNPYQIQRKNKKIIGRFKDEMNGTPIIEFVGLRPKLYCYRTAAKVCKKAKGVKECALRNISFDDYKRCLEKGEDVVVEQNLFRSYLHNICTIKQKKIALSSGDDKRYRIPDSYDTLPWGHYKLESDSMNQRISKYDTRKEVNICINGISYNIAYYYR